MSAATPVELPSDALPAGWIQEVQPDRVVVFLEGTDGPLRPSFSTEVRRTDTAVTLHDLRFSHVGDLVSSLTDVRVFDSGLVALGDRDAHRVLLAHRVDGVDVTLEQWAIPLRRRTTLLTASAATPEYAELVTDFHDLAESTDASA